MKIQFRHLFLSCLVFLYCFQITAQPLHSDTAVQIIPKFELGKSISYLVVEENKLDIPLFSLIGQHKFIAKFTILDTTNGHTMLYEVQTIKASDKRCAMESIKAKITDGLSLTYKLNKQGWVIDIPDYTKNQARVLQKLDSIIATEHFSQMDMVTLNVLKRNLAKPEGLEIILTPLLLFNDIFTKPGFRQHKEYHPARLNNIFYEPGISGTMILEMSKLNTKTNSAKVSVGFIGNQDSAVKYFTPVYQEIYRELTGKSAKYLPTGMKLNIEREYEINFPNGYPLRLSNKRIELYIERSVSRIIMEIVE